MLQISPDAVVVIFRTVMSSQNISRIQRTVIGMLEREEGIQQLCTLIDAVNIQSGGWMGESGEAHMIKIHPGATIWSCDFYVLKWIKFHICLKKYVL